MREVVISLVIFVSLAITLSGLTSCTGTKSAEQEPVSQPDISSGLPANPETADKGSAYPPIPQAIAQSDIRNLDNTTFRLDDKKGKVVLLNLWATWCGPCRSEMPTLVQLQDKYRDKGFEIIGIDTDDEPVSKINSFRNEMKLNYVLVWADADLQGELLKISQFPGIPQSFLVDRSGRLRGVFKGASPGDVRKLSEIVENVVSE